MAYVTQNCSWQLCSCHGERVCAGDAVSNDWGCLCEGTAQWNASAVLVQECLDDESEQIGADTQLECLVANGTWITHGCTEVLDYLAAAQSLSCSNTTLLDDVMTSVKLTCCAAPPANDTAMPVQPSTADAPMATDDEPDSWMDHWGCICPVEQSLLANSSFYLCESSDGEMQNVAPDECAAAGFNLTASQCKDTLTSLWQDYGFGCSDWSTFPAAVQNAMMQGCCTQPPPPPFVPLDTPPQQTAAVSPAPASPNGQTKAVACGGQCTTRYERCAGLGMTTRQPCCEPTDLCVVKNEFHAQVRACGLLLHLNASLTSRGHRAQNPAEMHE